VGVDTARADDTEWTHKVDCGVNRTLVTDNLEGSVGTAALSSFEHGLLELITLERNSTVLARGLQTVFSEIRREYLLEHGDGGRDSAEADLNVSCLAFAK